MDYRKNLILVVLLVLLLPSGFALTYIADVSPSHLKLEKGDLKNFDVYIKNGDAIGIELEVLIETPPDNLQIVGKDRQVLVLGAGEEKFTTFQFYGIDWADVPIVVDISLMFNNTVLDTYSYLVTIETNESEIFNNTLSYEFNLTQTRLNELNASLTELKENYNTTISLLIADKNYMLDFTANLSTSVENLKIVAVQEPPFNWSPIIYGSFGIIVIIIIVTVLNRLKLFDNIKRREEPIAIQSRRQNLNKQAEMVNELYRQKPIPEVKEPEPKPKPKKEPEPFK